MSYQLYFAPGACSLAPHIVLRELGEQFSLVKVSTKTHQTEDGADFYAINPKGYVPAIRLTNGEVLTEGAAISQYLADNKPSDLAPRAGTLERARLNEWLVFINSEVHKTFGGMFNPAITDDQKKELIKKLGTRFDFIEKSLGDGRAYLTGDKFTIADAYLFVVVNWSNFTGVDISAWPKLVAFQARVQARPHTQAAMKAEGLI